MSRRRKGPRPNTVKIDVVCTGRGAHEPFRFGVVLVDPSDDPFDFPPERVNAVMLDSALRRHTGADKPWGRQMDGEGTRTFPCPRCSSSTPFRHGLFCEAVCKLADAGFRSLDVSYRAAMLPPNST